MGEQFAMDVALLGAAAQIQPLLLPVPAMNVPEQPVSLVQHPPVLRVALIIVSLLPVHN